MASDSDDDDTTTIQIRLSPDKKRDWLDYLDSDSPHGTLTDLIKTSVDNRIDSKWVLKEKQDADTGDVPEDLGDALDNITERLAAIENRLDERELSHDPEDADNTLEEHELRRLAYQVHDKLPVVNDAEHLKSLVRHDSPTLDVQTRPSITGTAQDLSKAIDSPENDVRDALLYLERQDTETIESIVHDSTRRWFEVDPSVDRDPPSAIEIEEEADVDKDDLELPPASELNDSGAGE